MSLVVVVGAGTLVSVANEKNKPLTRELYILPNNYITEDTEYP